MYDQRDEIPRNARIEGKDACLAQAIPSTAAPRPTLPSHHQIGNVVFFEVAPSVRVEAIVEGAGFTESSVYYDLTLRATGLMVRSVPSAFVHPA